MKCQVCNNELPKYHSKYCNRVCQHKAQLKVCLGIDEFLIFILPMILLVGAATVGTAFAFPAAAALPPNTTDWNWGIVGSDGKSNYVYILPETPEKETYPDNYYENGYPNELIDDNLEEEEEEQDEKIHEEESREYDNER